jgi:hypothetical protein
MCMQKSAILISLAEILVTWEVADVGEIARLYWWYWFVVFESLSDILVVQRKEMERGHEILACCQGLCGFIGYQKQETFV